MRGVWSSAAYREGCRKHGAVHTAICCVAVAAGGGRGGGGGGDQARQGNSRPALLTPTTQHDAPSRPLHGHGGQRQGEGDGYPLGKEGPTPTAMAMTQQRQRGPA